MIAMVLPHAAFSGFLVEILHEPLLILSASLVEQDSTHGVESSSSMFHNHGSCLKLSMFWNPAAFLRDFECRVRGDEAKRFQ